MQTLVRSFPGMADYVLPEGAKGLAGVVVDSVNKCDPDVRKDLYQHVVLTGGEEEALPSAGVVFDAVAERLIPTSAGQRQKGLGTGTDLYGG